MDGAIWIEVAKRRFMAAEADTSRTLHYGQSWRLHKTQRNDPKERLNLPRTTKSNAYVEFFSHVRENPVARKGLLRLPL